MLITSRTAEPIASQHVRTTAVGRAAKPQTTSGGTESPKTSAPADRFEQFRRWSVRAQLLVDPPLPSSEREQDDLLQSSESSIDEAMSESSILQEASARSSTTSPPTSSASRTTSSTSPTTSLTTAPKKEGPKLLPKMDLTIPITTPEEQAAANPYLGILPNGKILFGYLPHELSEKLRNGTTGVAAFDNAKKQPPPTESAFVRDMDGFPRGTAVVRDGRVDVPGIGDFPAPPPGKTKTYNLRGGFVIRLRANKNGTVSVSVEKKRKGFLEIVLNFIKDVLKSPLITVFGSLIPGVGNVVLVRDILSFLRKPTIDGLLALLPAFGVDKNIINAITKTKSAIQAIKNGDLNALLEIVATTGHGEHVKIARSLQKALKAKELLKDGDIKGLLHLIADIGHGPYRNAAKALSKVLDGVDAIRNEDLNRLLSLIETVGHGAHKKLARTAKQAIAAIQKLRAGDYEGFFEELKKIGKGKHQEVAAVLQKGFEALALLDKGDLRGLLQFIEGIGHGKHQKAAKALQLVLDGRAALNKKDLQELLSIVEKIGHGAHHDVARVLRKAIAAIDAINADDYEKFFSIIEEIGHGPHQKIARALQELFARRARRA